MNQNARIIEKDIFDLLTTEAGDSEVIDLFGWPGGSSRFSLQAIYDVSAPSAKDFTDTDVTVEDSTVTITDHGFTTGLKIQLTTDGTLPAPLLTATDYFVIVIDADTIQFASSFANAAAGTFIVIEDAGSVGATNTVTPVALAGASVTFKKSNDAVNWINIQAATSIAADGTVMLTQPDVSYRYFKAVKALTAGVVDLKGLILVIGDPE